MSRTTKRDTVEINDRHLLISLQELFACHGVMLEERGWWLVGKNGVAVSADADISKADEEGISVCLDISVSLPGGRLITEACWGFGEDLDSSLENARADFTLNSFHVILTAFFDHPADEQVTVEQWDVDGTRWRLVAGNFGGRVSEDTSDWEVPSDLMDRIEEAMRSSSLVRNVHWFRVFFRQEDGKTRALACLKDNEPWTEATDPLSRVSWEKRSGFDSIRNFSVLQRMTPGESDRLTQSDALSKGVDFLVKAWSNGNPADVALYRKLTNAGIPGDLAEKLIIFVPLGFSNVLLHHAELPTTYQIVGVDGSLGQECNLYDEPAFQEARAYAQRTSPERLLAVASRCAIVNAALNLGENIDDLVGNRGKGLELQFTPAAVSFPRFSPPPKQWFSTRVPFEKAEQPMTLVGKLVRRFQRVLMRSST